MVNYLLGILGLFCAIWVIYDVVANQKKMKTVQKVLWIVFSILFSILTAIIYYFAVKKK
jgi:hypothetical protein